MAIFRCLLRISDHLVWKSGSEMLSRQGFHLPESLLADKQGQPCVSSVSSLKKESVVEGCPCLSGNVVTPQSSPESSIRCVF